jgi:hypothetical protein
MNDDAQNLRYLTLGHYICAAIAALFACIPLIHLSIGLSETKSSLSEAMSSYQSRRLRIDG